MYLRGMWLNKIYLLPKFRHQLQDEPKLKYRRLFCMDRNDSLKQIWAIGQHQTADLRVFMESDYYIPREEVDKFANEVRECEVNSCVIR